MPKTDYGSFLFKCQGLVLFILNIARLMEFAFNLCFSFSFLCGRFSVSNDLKYDAERDLRDIGAKNILVHSLNKVCKFSIQ